jgi:Polyketide cyclase / dehydrase and lipid transport
MYRRTERSEHLGDVATVSSDLDERFRALQLAQDPVVPAVSHWSATLDLPAAPAVVWEWLNDPAKQSRWVGNRTVEAELPPQGRTGPGTVYHCHYGNAVVDHTIVDWRPFSSFSEEVRPRPGARALLMRRLEPFAGGTRLRLDVGLAAPLPNLVRRRLCCAFAERELRSDRASLEQAIGEAVAA